MLYQQFSELVKPIGEGRIPKHCVLEPFSIGVGFTNSDTVGPEY